MGGLFTGDVNRWALAARNAQEHQEIAASAFPKGTERGGNSQTELIDVARRMGQRPDKTPG